MISRIRDGLVLPEGVGGMESSATPYRKNDVARRIHVKGEEN